LIPPVFYAVATGAGVASLGFRLRGLRGFLKAVALGLIIAFPAWLVFLVVSAPIYSILPPPKWLETLFEELAPQTDLELLVMVLTTLIVVAPCEVLRGSDLRILLPEGRLQLGDADHCALNP